MQALYCYMHSLGGCVFPFRGTSTPDYAFRVWAVVLGMSFIEAWDGAGRGLVQVLSSVVLRRKLVLVEVGRAHVCGVRIGGFYVDYM